MRNLRNIIIAVLLLIFLLVTPFWGKRTPTVKRGQRRRLPGA